MQQAAAIPAQHAQTHCTRVHQAAAHTAHRHRPLNHDRHLQKLAEQQQGCGVKEACGQVKASAQGCTRPAALPVLAATGSGCSSRL